MKPKGTIVTVLLAFFVLVAQQEGYTQSRKQDGKKSFPVKITSSKDERPKKYGMWKYGRCHLAFGLRFDRFLTDRFYQYNKMGVLNPKLGYEGSFSVVFVRPLELEATAFTSAYSSPLPDMSDVKVKHKGMEFFLNAYVMPYMGKVSDYLAPYVGIGYQTSSLKWGNDISAKTSSAIVKMGLRVPFVKGIFLQGEYRQTIPKKSDKIFRVVNIGLGFSF